MADRLAQQADAQQISTEHQSDWQADWAAITGEPYSFESFSTRCNPADVAIIFRCWARAARDGGPFQCAYRVLDRHGVYVRVCANIVRSGEEWHGRIALAPTSIDCASWPDRFLATRN